MDTLMLDVRNLSKSYKNIQVLKDIKLEVSRGEFLVIMGASGSGKSTLLHCISGMDVPTSGEIYIDGFNISKAKEIELEKLRANEEAFIFQEPCLVSNLTVKENILISGIMAVTKEKGAGNDVLEKVTSVMENVNISHIQESIPSQISGGEAQRVAIARAIVKEPQLLFADEPTGALNSSNSEDIMHLLSNIHIDGQTIIMVTHSKEAALYGDRIIYLEDGMLKAELNLSKVPKTEKRDLLDEWLKEMRW